MIPQRIIDEINSMVIKSVDRVLIDCKEGRIETEPSLTDRLLANIERDFEAQSFRFRGENIKIRARTLRDRGRNAPENIFMPLLVSTSFPVAQAVVGMQLGHCE